MTLNYTYPLFSVGLRGAEGCSHSANTISHLSLELRVCFYKTTSLACDWDIFKGLKGSLLDHPWQFDADMPENVLDQVDSGRNCMCAHASLMPSEFSQHCKACIERMGCTLGEELGKSLP